MNITYLLGAGASQQCLPVVSEMSEKINETIEWISQASKSNARLFLSSDYRSMISDLKALAEICEPKRNFSIDTYAKKLKISGMGKEYDKLKNTLTLFFTLQQLRNFPDVRYDNFWASLINQRDELPNNIKILSWNYDFQLELTYQDFIRSDSLIDSATALNLVSHKTPIDNYRSTDAFTIFKINGSATYNSEAIRGRQNYVVNNLKSSPLPNAIEEIINYQSFKGIENHLSYAWEHNISNKFFKHLLECVKLTNVLVIIGYSFPFFNRTVDKLIIDSMINLGTVYIQDPNASNIAERFSAIRFNEGHIYVKEITDTYQFTLPNEL